MSVAFHCWLATGIIRSLPMHEPPQSSFAEGPSAAALFEAIWVTLVDMLGTAATATLLRRSIKRASAEIGHGFPAIERSGFDYTYKCPPTWDERAPESLGALRSVARELTPLLASLTGVVVLRRLAALPIFEKEDIRFEVIP